MLSRQQVGPGKTFITPARIGWKTWNQHQIGRVGGKDDASKLHHSRSSKPGFPVCSWDERREVHAISSPESPTIFEKTFTLKTGEYLRVSSSTENDSQSIRLNTNLASPNLILHWGVEGGKGYKGGWRLPERKVWPEGTVQYKKRALQTPWRRQGDEQEVIILLKGEEVSDALNFVVKDAKINRWHDNNGSNFTVALKTGAVTESPADVVLPQELCGIWAYINWELAGCPNRSQAEADAEYRAGIEELETLVARGISLDEIWKVAKGEIPLADFKADKDLVTKPIEKKIVESVVKEATKHEAPVQEPVIEEKKDSVVGESIAPRGRNYLDLIKVPVLSAEKSKKRWKPMDSIVQSSAVNEATKWRRLFPLGSSAELFAVVQQEGDGQPYEVIITTDVQFPVVLHWGISKQGKRRGWTIPPASLMPVASRVYDDGKAAETPFFNCEDEECDLEVIGAEVPLQRTRMQIPFDADIGAIQFVLRSDDKTRWWKDGSGNFLVPIPDGGRKVKEVSDSAASVCQDALSQNIIKCESSDHWTLMHRFNKAADFLGQAVRGFEDDIEVVDAVSRIYCWLRYSATRQLTWQRSYNTKPRELSHSQERLTQAIAEAHGSTSGEVQEWVKLMLGTVGRGGDGQKIRDEILHIMHRHKIPEKKGLWMEAWHQKLHNNTTPDDVPICEAYIAFMENNGDISTYWRVLSDAGITRQRLEGFDRPIVTEPEYYAEKRDGLIRDMYNYLGILKAVHSGADLEAASAACQNIIPGQAQGHLGYVLSHLGHPEILPFMEAAVEARTEIAKSVTGNLNLMYLDLALENQIRQAAERGAGITGAAAAGLITPLLQNLCLSAGENEEICFCLQSWEGLPQSVREGHLSQEEALQAVAVVDRIRRALSDISDKVFQRIGESSKVMGEAFGCEKWAVDIFSEEVVRGGPAFAVSLVLSTVETSLRSIANLGSWQVISPASVVGRVVNVPGLHDVQELTYEEPTILIAERVGGEEEIPEGVVGVLTPDAPDVLSHVSVRARNMKVLFATCYESWHLEEIAKQEKKVLSFKPTASGEVRWEKGSEEQINAASASSIQQLSGKNLNLEAPKWCRKWAIMMDEYNPQLVGAKSRNIAGLREQIPDWIQLPSSVTIPFGAFEAVLELNANREIKEGIQRALKSIPDGPAKALRVCRELAIQVSIPEELKNTLSASMESAGIPLPESPERWNQAMMALKGVWASKYNDRAYFSMRKVGLSLENLRMAVLVQRIVSPQYAFVIHTKNPSTGNDKEIYCELVKGLGESLVSGMVPGSSMAFVGRKADLSEPQVVLYPSKSSGMYVRDSLIFRSDSNGEDLEGYAGAGLYESITMDPSELETVDYVADRLMKDSEYRNTILSRVCEVGLAIEQALGSAQDIEGVISQDGKITVVQTRPQV